MPQVQLNNNITGVGSARQAHSVSTNTQATESFSQALRTQMREQESVKLSAHAQKRLSDRQVQFDQNAQQRLDAAVDRVSEKGADKSLVLMDDLALVVSARNRVVITAVDSASAKEGVFTNIESAVIA